MGLLKIRPITAKDREGVLSILKKTRVFTSEEIRVAMELVDIVLEDREQKDYSIFCGVGDSDELLGYVCYGPCPMTRGTFDLYWIAVDPCYRRMGVGSGLLQRVEKEVRRRRGRMILADTASIPKYAETHRFYLAMGFKKIARVRDYYNPGNDRITFCKRLI